MYPYLCLRIRKFFKGVWNRHFTSKRERTPSSSLQACLEQPADRKGLWRNWFVLLLVAPLLYYLIFVGRARQYELLTNGFRLSPQKTPPVSSETNEKTTTPSLLDIPPMPHNKDSSHFYGDIASNQQHKKNASHSSLVSPRGKNKGQGMAAPTTASDVSELPWCKYYVNKADTAVKPRNVSEDQLYRNDVQVGGYFAPKQCKSRHKVAILVPFRERESNLAVFLYNIHPFLIDQLLDYRIFVIEQKGKGLFNKGRLFNAGYEEAKKLDQWDCLVFHDVDLLPMSKLIQYTCPTWPRHMCPTVVEDGKSHSSYHTFFGGVSAMSMKHFAKVNGYSNLYWGWGGEDSDMFWRLRAVGLPIMRYHKDIAKYMSLPHLKPPECQNRNELLKTAMERYSKDGLSTLTYEVMSMKLLHLYTHILVDIQPASKKGNKTIPGQHQQIQKHNKPRL